MRAGDRVCVAVSGGADSVALLRVLLELRAELGIVLAVAHFNHGLRGNESEADEAFVADLARQHGLEFFAGRADVCEHAAKSKLSVEAAGRELRYQWLTRLAEDQRFDSIATAHTLDDQAETVLLKFLRGAGTRGLAGIYPSVEVKNSKNFRARLPSLERQDPSREAAAGVEPGAQSGAPDPSRLYADWGTEAPGGRVNQSEPRSGGMNRIVRPMLCVTRDDVESYLTSLGQTWREDESNLDHRFARNRIRHELLPLLEREYNSNIRQVLSGMAEVSRAEEKYWQALVERELEPRMQPQQLGLAKFEALPLALQRRLLRRFAETAGLSLDFDHVEELLRCAHREQSQTELPGGWAASRRGECLELCPPQPEPSCVGYECILPIPGEVHIAEVGLTLRATTIREKFAAESAETDDLLAAELLGPELTVRNWRHGDRFWPAHTGSAEKLKRLFAEKHIPAEQRPSWPVALSGQQIVWVRGFPVARTFAWQGRGDAVRIEWEDRAS